MNNPKLLLRAKNCSIGSTYYFCPASSIFINDNIEYGTQVKIIKKVSQAKRGKSIVKVRALVGKQEEFNTMISNLTINK